MDSLYWMGCCGRNCHSNLNSMSMSEFKSTCKKVCYKSRKEAKAKIKDLNHNKGFSLTDVYYCEDCSYWHVTHMKKSDSRKYTRHLKSKKK